MDYDYLAHLVARDLTAYLSRRIPELDLPVYAVGLYVEDYFVVSIATESSPQDREQSGPGGLRWSSGEWAIPAEEFLTAETEEALAPPVTRPYLDMALDIPAELICGTSHQFEEIAFRALELATPLPMLPPSVSPGCSWPMSTTSTRERRACCGPTDRPAPPHLPGVAPAGRGPPGRASRPRPGPGDPRPGRARPRRSRPARPRRADRPAALVRARPGHGPDRRSRQGLPGPQARQPAVLTRPAQPPDGRSPAAGAPLQDGAPPSGSPMSPPRAPPAGRIGDVE